MRARTRNASIPFSLLLPVSCMWAMLPSRGEPVVNITGNFLSQTRSK
jgi:hypothetical protein